MTFTFQHLERWPLALAWLVIIVFVLTVGYRNAPLRRPAKLVAALCKLLAAILIGICLLDPVSVRELPKAGANEVLIIADNSQSMQTKGATETAKRSEVLRSALLSSDGKSEPGWLVDLRRDFRVRMLAVGQKSNSIADASKLTFDQTGSRLASAISHGRKSGAGRSVAAVVVLSDGLVTDQTPQPLTTDGAPIFPVLIGSSAAERDLSLTDVTASETAFEDSPVTVTTRITQAGCGGMTVSVKISDEKNAILATEQHRFGPEEKSRSLNIKVPLAKPGVSFLKVTASLVTDQTKPVAIEAELANNTRMIAVDRGTGPYRVLYVGGRPNWDYKFLRRALTADPEVQMPALLRVARREPKFEWRGRPGETSNPLFKGFGAKGGEDVQRYDQPVMIRLNTRDAKELADGFPKTPEALMGEFRAIILDDVEADFFSQEQMNLIEKFVSQRGGSLLMLGGQECFGPGKYDNTPVGRMLPVYLDKSTNRPAVADAPLNLTREGFLEPWVRLRANQPDEETRIASMPAFFSINQTFSIKPGASVLATAGNEEDSSTPVLITQKFGNGRVTALTVADVWRWGMKDAEQQADMQRFWRQMVRHLIVDVPDRVEFKVEPVGDESHRLLTRVHDERFGAQDDATVTYKVQNGSKPAVELSAEPSLKEAGLYESQFQSAQSGTYLATATAKDSQGKLLAEKQTGWTSNPIADETKSLTPDKSWMERLAKDTKGRLLSVADLPDLPKLMSALKLPAVERKTSPLWHHPLYLTAILVLLIGEWLIRRRAGWI